MFKEGLNHDPLRPLLGFKTLTLKAIHVKINDQLPV